MSEFPRTEQEERCDQIFPELEKLFRRLGKAKPEKYPPILKDITTKLKEAKALIKDFEREARADNMPARELQDRRRAMADELNRFIEMKTEFTRSEASKGELFDPGAAGPSKQDVEMGRDGMTTQQIVGQGRKEMKEIDKTLDRAERVANETKDIGIATAAKLVDQTAQLNKIMDDVNEVEFNIKKATAVIRDITRGLLTDKCIGFLLFLVAAGVVAIIVVKATGVVDKKKKSTPPPAPSPPPGADPASTAAPASGRRMLLSWLLELAQEMDNY